MALRMHHEKGVDVRRSVGRRVTRHAPKEAGIHTDPPCANLTLPDPGSHAGPEAQQAYRPTSNIRRRVMNKDT
eukprot:5489658-Pyramimonas_sp.AAC.2